jgi:hypothetical protein
VTAKLLLALASTVIFCSVSHWTYDRILFYDGSGSLQTSTFVSNEVTAESDSLYDWRFAANQFVLAPSPLQITTGDFFH